MLGAVAFIIQCRAQLGIPPIEFRSSVVIITVFGIVGCVWIVPVLIDNNLWFASKTLFCKSHGTFHNDNDYNNNDKNNNNNNDNNNDDNNSNDNKNDDDNNNNNNYYYY